jgi:hypothetical protein
MVSISNLLLNTYIFQHETYKLSYQTNFQDAKDCSFDKYINFKYKAFDFISRNGSYFAV